MENDPFEDVFPIENGDFPLLCLITGAYFITKKTPTLGGNMYPGWRIRVSKKTLKSRDVLGKRSDPQDLMGFPCFFKNDSGWLPPIRDSLKLKTQSEPPGPGFL